MMIYGFYLPQLRHCSLPEHLEEGLYSPRIFVDYLEYQNWMEIHIWIFDF